MNLAECKTIDEVLQKYGRDVDCTVTDALHQAALIGARLAYEDSAGIAFTIGKHAEDAGMALGETLGGKIRDVLFEQVNHAAAIVKKGM